ncbi:MAG: helix-turn-helix domain-containing protein [Clostridia bacterium]|nr:helix-turn-helix domain-containing protein [Clostridia bacterium]
MDGLKTDGNIKKADDMREANGGNAERTLKEINLEEMLSCLPKAQREQLISGYDMKKFAKIFEDEGMMRTAEAFLDSGMNVSETARILYMHRNTLIYRLGVIKRRTGLDLRNFKMAMTFKLLHCLYLIK